MRIVVTNDDGIESEGLHVLAAAMVDAGHDVLVVAPDRNFSGAGSSLGNITGADAVAVEQVELPGRPDVPAWQLDGPPGLCVLAARMGAFGESPELVVSGINAGLNTGRAVLHSGTVGAALTGQNFGLSGLAVSVAVGPDWQWHTAADLAVNAVETLAAAPARSVLNLNVPALPRDEVRGLRWARLAPFGEVQTAGAAIDGARLQFTFAATGKHPDHGTDQGLVAAGFATLTALAGLAEAWPHDEGAAPGVEITESMVPGAPCEPVHTVPDSAAIRSIHHTLVVPPT